MAQKEIISFVFIGNIKTRSVLGSYPLNPKHDDACRNIFSAFLSTNDTVKYNTVFKTTELSTEYKYLISSNNIFYCTYSEFEISDDYTKALVSELEKANIYLLTENSTQMLNEIGKKEFQKVFIEYNNSTSITPLSNSSRGKVDDIQGELKKTKDIVKSGIQNIIANSDSLKDIEETSVQIKSTSEQFKTQTKALSIKAMWENRKIKIIIISIIILIVIILFIYLCCKKS
jgi:hypothetical protein